MSNRPMLAAAILLGLSGCRAAPPQTLIRWQPVYVPVRVPVPVPYSQPTASGGTGRTAVSGGRFVDALNGRRVFETRQSNVDTGEARLTVDSSRIQASPNINGVNPQSLQRALGSCLLAIGDIEREPIVGAKSVKMVIRQKAAPGFLQHVVVAESLDSSRVTFTVTTRGFTRNSSGRYIETPVDDSKSEDVLYDIKTYFAL